jgi:hypothetical protein
MAYTTIDDPSAYFQVKLWTGNASSNEITFDGNSDLQADWIWHKEPNDSNGWHQTDTSIGIANYLASDSSAAEYGVGSAYVSAIGSNSITYGSGDSSFNSNSVAQATWAWKVNGGTTTSLTSNINSVCQVNQDAGISIVKYTCTGGGNGQSVQHGLGLVPQVIITKNRTDTSYSDWITYHHSLGYANFLKLNTTAASAGNSPYNGGAPTSTTYNVSIDLVESPKDYVSYVFAPIQGYSKFGKYVGNLSVNGPFVYTGFKPALIMIKRAVGGTSSYSSWAIHDSKRLSFNSATGGDKVLWANGNYVEGTRGQGGSNNGETARLDILSNGFKIRDGGSDEMNDPDDTYIYMAFAENPFTTSTGVPTTAR